MLSLNALTAPELANKILNEVMNEKADNELRKQKMQGQLLSSAANVTMHIANVTEINQNIADLTAQIAAETDPKEKNVLEGKRHREYYRLSRENDQESPVETEINRQINMELLDKTITAQTEVITALEDHIATLS